LGVNKGYDLKLIVFIIKNHILLSKTKCRLVLAKRFWRNDSCWAFGGFSEEPSRKADGDGVLVRQKKTDRLSSHHKKLFQGPHCSI
jgi:hypothetical protein